MGKKESARVSEYAQGIEMRGSHKGVACSALEGVCVGGAVREGFKEGWLLVGLQR